MEQKIYKLVSNWKKYQNVTVYKLSLIFVIEKMKIQNEDSHWVNL